MAKNSHISLKGWPLYGDPKKGTSSVAKELNLVHLSLWTLSIYGSYYTSKGSIWIWWVNDIKKILDAGEISQNDHVKAVGTKHLSRTLTYYLHIQGVLLVDTIFFKKAPVLPIVWSPGTVYLQGQPPLAHGVSHQHCPPSIFFHLLCRHMVPIHIHINSRVTVGPDPPHLHTLCIGLGRQATG